MVSYFFLQGDNPSASAPTDTVPSFLMQPNTKRRFADDDPESGDERE